MSSISQITSRIRNKLDSCYPTTEIAGFIRILFMHYANMSPLELHLRSDEDIPVAIEIQIFSAVDELLKYRPIQYITGETEFYGLAFHLTPDVLIPRQETEELTDLIIRKYQNNSRHGSEAGFPKILDIGTGSGCIAVSLASVLSHAEVWATDFSAAALTVAEKNAESNKVQLHPVHADILSDDADKLFPEKYFDTIVSNPPYVSQADKRLMQPNVLDYEPHSALFPQGDDPLVFYKRIADFGLKHLADEGSLFFEINESFHEETAEILTLRGYIDVTTIKDINGKWRIVFARKK